MDENARGGACTPERRAVCMVDARATVCGARIM
jgi:hypothetical protein